MKKWLTLVLMCVGFSFAPVRSAQAQTGILEIIKAGVVKVIKAVDLQIQRLQNKTIWLQNAQKVLENKMSALKLGEIGGWVQKQKDLYSNYFDELWKIKSVLATYQQVKNIVAKQLQLVHEYSRVYNLTRQDKNFTASEVSYISSVYSGILTKSIHNLDQLQLVVDSFVTQMTDAKRLEIIHRVSAELDENLADLRRFNQENIRTSLQRSKEKNEIDVVKKLYGIQ